MNAQKIIRLQAENVKRLSAVEIAPSGNVVVIGGDNAQGKSSVLDAIAMALGGKNEVPAMPVRRGEKSARVVLETDDFVIRRTFTESGGGALVIENKEGLKYPSPQALLDRLTGKLTFDPLAFTRLDERAQARQLRELVGLDFSKLDSERASLYSQRTLVNRDQQGAAARLAAMPPRASVEYIDPAGVEAEIDAALARNSEGALLKSKAEAFVRELAGIENEGWVISGEIERLNETLCSIQKQISQAQGRLEQTREAYAAKKAEGQRAQSRASEFVPADVAALRDKQREVVRNNRVFEANASLDKAAAEVEEHRKKSAALTEKIDAIDAQKMAALAGAKFPVPGLSFDENGVTYNGIPFAQASSAEQLRVSVAMACALNPAIRVMFVRDGSLLDDKSFALLRDLVNENKMQLWLERVGRGECVSVVIEDGRVLAEKPEDLKA